MKTESTRRILFVLMLLVVPFLFTSCIDYVQAISYSDGEYHFYYKYTLFRALYEMADEESDDSADEVDAAEIEESAGIADRMPDNMKKTPVKTEFEEGDEITFSVNPRTTDEKQKSVLPTTAGNKYYIPFMMGEVLQSANSLPEDSEAMLAAMLSTAKCRVVISKKIIPTFTCAYFEGVGAKNYSVPMYDLGDVWCAEIPFLVLFQSDTFKTDRLVVLKE